MLIFEAQRTSQDRSFQNATEGGFRSSPSPRPKPTIKERDFSDSCTRSKPSTDYHKRLSYQHQPEYRAAADFTDPDVRSSSDRMKPNRPLATPRMRACPFGLGLNLPLLLLRPQTNTHSYAPARYFTPATTRHFSVASSALFLTEGYQYDEGKEMLRELLGLGMILETKAFSQGRRAFREGLGEDANPYTASTTFRSDWAMGWREARRTAAAG